MKGPYISKIRIYPLKALDLVEVLEAEVGQIVCQNIVM